MHDFTVEFLKCAKFHGKFMEGVREIHGKFTGPTAVISRCYVNANEEICRIAHLKFLNNEYLLLLLMY